MLTQVPAMPAINSQNHQLNYSKAEIGSYALDLFHLSQLGIPLPATYCLPISTLKLIANHNRLEEKFSQLIANACANSPNNYEKTVQQVQTLITNLAIPDTVRNTLFSIYQEHFKGDFVRLTASPVDNLPLDYKREDNIQGEANLIESILTLWARNIDPADIKKKQLYPVAIVIQAQFQPSSSGLAYSLDLNTYDKSKISIKAVWGVFESKFSINTCDYILIDRRDWSVLSKNIFQKTKAYQRAQDNLKPQKIKPTLQSQLALDIESAIKLAKLVSLIKLQFTHQVMVHWELIDNNLLITKIKPYFPTPLSKNTSQQLTTIALGQSVNPGYIQGVAQVITNQ
ncbi:MAG TPA: PEP/pyruvate-binding domain-containing protein, partial [Candidatus Woesebacteria bacterium]|nr:PEP/pyruvate-binding domain-containing protein [Candidatus Woesebacteria bacterium]